MRFEKFTGFLHPGSAAAAQKHVRIQMHNQVIAGRIKPKKVGVEGTASEILFWYITRTEKHRGYLPFFIFTIVNRDDLYVILPPDLKVEKVIKKSLVFIPTMGKAPFAGF